MNLLDFYNSFEREDVPNALIKLVGFENDFSGYECYANGFGIGTDYKGGIATWSDKPEFLNRFYPFADANGSGSFYGIWDDGSGVTLDHMPIVAFGDDGGLHIVAENVVQLMHLLTYDTEISVDFDEVYFYKDDNYHKPSEDHEAYVEFIKTDYKLEPLSETESIIKNAQSKYKAKFDEWCSQFFEV